MKNIIYPILLLSTVGLTTICANAPYGRIVVTPKE